MTDPARVQPAGIGGILFGWYAWIAFVTWVLVAIFCALLVPGLDRRRRCVTFCARMPFTCAGIRTSVSGREKIPSGDCIVVANHASYLDGVLLQACLPPKFAYVIKGEMERVPVVGFLLKRIGAKFVERFDISASARDARQLLRAAQGGESLAFFPEGTFLEIPGLSRFRNGAFAAAIAAGVPIVPVVISGSRQVLPGGKLLPRHGHLRVEILDPIDCGDPAYCSSRELADAARRAMLAVLDEPDLLVGESD